ncbi:MAG: class I SAM-dependent methyltransferase [Nanoarchaeota archaeon]|nr:class I SAM-dependent methyltransferase [Nanoarchaeota archaeon]
MKHYAKNTMDSFDNNVDEYMKNTEILQSVDWLKKFCQKVKGKRILDLGCGPGRDCIFFMDNGFDAYGTSVFFIYSSTLLSNESIVFLA